MVFKDKALAAVAAGLILVAQIFVPAPTAAQASPRANTPNIIVIYADDLGYGDVGAYGGKAVVTPHLDAMAANGLRFTDGHATAATCTPSRYSLLTGQYAFRKRAAILQGDAPLLIAPGRETIASLLSAKGYATAVVGKWPRDWRRCAGSDPGQLQPGSGRQADRTRPARSHTHDG